MLSRRSKSVILSALEHYRGDNLERATAAFRGCTPHQMTMEYGLSGQTRQAILDQYRQHVAEVEAAMEDVRQAGEGEKAARKP